MTESTSSPASLSADDKKHNLAMAVQVLSEIADSLEDGSHSKTLSQKSFDEKFDRQHSQISDLHKDIKELNLKLEENNRLLKEQAKMKRLALAHSRSGFGQFVFHTLGCHQGTYSKSIAEEIITCFIFGCSCTLSKDLSVLEDKGLYEGCASDTGEFRAGKTAFREKIVAQIGVLIGHEPRLVDNEDGSFALYYE